VVFLLSRPNEIRGSHGSENSDCGVLDYDTV
jgi:hypothetical protein